MAVMSSLKKTKLVVEIRSALIFANMENKILVLFIIAKKNLIL